MIGQTVLISSGDIDKPATGGAELTYALDEQAASVDAVILAADGTELRRYTGLPTEAEEAHDLYWDGNDAAGLPMPEGQYTVKIEALDADGDPLAYETFVGASVDSVIYSNGMTQLALSNGTVVASTEVYEVR
jgi:flagellar basal-body rod modification protein FlgD